MTPFEHPNAFVRRIRSPALRALGMVPFVTSVVAMLAFSHGTATSLNELIFRAGLVLFGTLAAANVSAGPPRRGDVRIDEQGLHVGGSLAMARDDIVAVHLKSARSSTVVLVPRTGPALELALSHVVETDQVLTALGRPTLTALRFETVSPWLDRITRALEGSKRGALALAGLGFLLAVVSPWLFASVLAMFGMERATSSAIEVGRDGVLVTALGTRRFVPFTDVKEVALTAFGAISFTLTSGQQVLATAGAMERARVLLKRIERCRQAAASEISEADARRVLQDDRRLLGARLPELRRLGRTVDASYREAALPRDQLWRIVEDTTLDATTRLGAAVALSGELAETDRARLRVVAEATASPRTRIALEAVAAEAGDDRRLTEALAELEAEEDRRLLARKKS